ncbi:CLUMA_CG005417, isoform A [Clunio marinus]|uniref:CLUMA_CG005417, isoform A n=1 Tax=Clunio marinus TaxID=568069 RepID=A0A1J1HW59_9DIPT|nr:CLUMA_CG005417, isoform A [Clunio marinus]
MWVERFEQVLRNNFPGLIPKSKSLVLIKFYVNERNGIQMPRADFPYQWIMKLFSKIWHFSRPHGPLVVLGFLMNENKNEAFHEGNGINLLIFIKCGNAAKRFLWLSEVLR